MVLFRARVLGTGFSLSVLVGCGGGLALAPSGPHPLHIQEFVEVDYPPPPNQVEEIPESVEGEPDCVWTDGHYDWDGSWMWRPGRWVLPPEDCYYAPPVVAWSKTRDPKLYYSPPRWYREEASTLPEARAVCSPPPTCPGTQSADASPR